MKYVIFPSFSYANQERPPLLHPFFCKNKVTILTGPTESGLYLIEGDKEDIEKLKEYIYPFYIVFEDFEPPTMH